MDYPSYEQGRMEGRMQGRNEGNNGGGDGLGCLLAILCLIILAWACLYPLSALLTLGTWFGIHALVEPWGAELKGLNRALILYALPSLGAAVVMWLSSRWDHRLADNGAYCITRHVVRLTLFALIIMLVHLHFQEGLPPFPPSYAYDSFWQRLYEYGKELGTTLPTDSIRLGLGVFAVVIGHLCLWHWEWLRNGWRESLEGLRLRPRT